MSETTNACAARHALRALASLGLQLALACAAPPAPAPAPHGWQLVVLGIAQDGGMPHLGCERAPCSEARAGRRRAEKVVALGLVHEGLGLAYLFEATPDLPAQVHALTGGRAPDGIFLTHAHVGHYTGLAFLGQEVLGARGVPVFATERMGRFLADNAPWSRLVEEQRIELRRLLPDVPVELPGGVRVTALRVPHRDELSDTVGFRVDGPRASALLVPDVDRWELWERDVGRMCDEVDLAFLDGTFASPDELPGRDMSQVPHPLLDDTRARVAGRRARVWFVHLNHTNRALVDGGPDIAHEGQRFDL